MPELKIVVACEKVIIDQAGPVSLIGIFQRINIRLPEAPTPERAIVAGVWFAFCLWESGISEGEQEFTQILKVLAPDGTLFAEQETTFKNDFPESSKAKIAIQFPAMPVWSEGSAEVRVSLKGDAIVLGSYTFDIRYLPTEVLIQDAAAKAT